MSFIDAATDPYVLIRFMHLAGAIIAVGAVTVTDSLLLLLHFKKSFAPVFAKLSSELSLIVWKGLFLLSGSGIYLVLSDPGIVHSSVFQLKMGLVAVIFLNGIILNERVTPRFRKASKNWEDQEVRDRFERNAGIFALVSLLGWWAIIFLVYLKQYI